MSGLIRILSLALTLSIPAVQAQELENLPYSDEGLEPLVQGDFDLDETGELVVPRLRNLDPFENLNRKMFAFNNGFDRYLARPLAVGYQYVLPNRMKRGVGNFFANLYDVTATANGVLQGDIEMAGVNASRFIVNSTLGIFGFMDVATRLGIAPHRTDFGQTLAVWGMENPGPYLMVPFFGPRTVRSGLGTMFDTVIAPQSQLTNVPLRNTLYGLELIDGRAALLSADELLSGDAYIFVRDAYLSQREFLVNEGSVDDHFSDFGEDWDEEEW